MAEDTTAWIALGTSVVTGIFVILKQLRKSQCVSRCCQVKADFSQRSDTNVV